MAQHRPLPASGLTLWSRTCQALAIPWEVENIPAAASKYPCRGIPPVHGSLRGHLQSSMTGAALTGVDIIGDLAYHQHQYIITSEKGRQAVARSHTQPPYQGESVGGPTLQGIQVRVRGSVPPRFYPPFIRIHASLIRCGLKARRY